LAAGETALIASQLTTVPGRHYVDITKSELNDQLSMIRSSAQKAGDSMPAVSLYSVVADDPAQNPARTASGSSETGFLTLVEFATAPSLGERENLPSSSKGYTGREVIDGTTVFKFTDASRPDSKYTYVWLRHGVLASFDGATKAPTERWVHAYLAIPELQQTEPSRLSSSLALRWAGYGLVGMEEMTSVGDAPPRVTDRAAVAGAATKEFTERVGHASPPIGDAAHPELGPMSLSSPLQQQYVIDDERRPHDRLQEGQDHEPEGP